jgi:hypothetical protein
MMISKRLVVTAFAALFCLSACNAPAYHARANFDAAGQALGNGKVGAGASYTGHGFVEGAQATGQAISTGAQDAGHAISNTVKDSHSN